MPKQKNHSVTSPVKPGMPEPTTDAAEITVLKDAADAESQAAPTASDRLADTATSPVKHDAFENSDMSGQTTDANPSPAEAGTEESTSPQSPHDDTPEAGVAKDEAGAESQVPAAPSNTLENNLPVTAEVEQPAKPDDGGCFEPYIPQDPVSPAPEPVQKPKPSTLGILFDKYLRDNGMARTPTDIKSETASPAPAAAEGKGDAEMVQPSEILPAPVEAPLPPPRVATAVELFKWIKRSILAQTHLSKDSAEFVALWVISTWFQDALTILPCLVITGPAYDARGVLRVLHNFCWKPALLAGFRRSHLRALHYGCHTSLVSEPSLDRRTAELLGDLTDRNFRVADGDSLMCFSKSTAIYAGESPETHKIQNSIHIHITPTHAALPDPPEWLQKMIKRVPVHLGQYRDKNLSYVDNWTWFPSGLSSETKAIAVTLGKCIVNAPELRQKLVALLKTEDKRRRSERSNTRDAVVLEATRTLCRDGRKHAYAREIAAAANHLFETRGEAARLSPEKAGHSLKRLGLHTHELSPTGNGLTFDEATVAEIQRLAAEYGKEDTPAET